MATDSTRRHRRAVLAYRSALVLAAAPVVGAVATVAAALWLWSAVRAAVLGPPTVAGLILFVALLALLGACSCWTWWACWVHRERRLARNGRNVP